MFRSQQSITGEDRVLTESFAYAKKNPMMDENPKADMGKLKMPYYIEGIPVEIHIHGIGAMDFSDQNYETLELSELQKMFAQEGVMGTPTVFLAREKLKEFADLLKRFSQGKEKGLFPNILGFALEGPILVSAGGTPEKGRWNPNREEWKTIYSFGGYGLLYMVISPDWEIEKLKPVLKMLLKNGIRPALGHCRKDTIRRSLLGIHESVRIAKNMGFMPYSGAILTDHLFNDMPRKFIHAWRCADERRRRAREFPMLSIDDWNFNDLNEQIGEIPASLLRYARDGWIMLLLNFDGEHVDLQICRRVYEMVGADAIIAMTDRIEKNVFGGAKLHKAETGTLWYREKGCVAAGSSTLDEQMKNMRSLNIPEEDIWKMCGLNAMRIFRESSKSNVNKRMFSHVDHRHSRTSLNSDAMTFDAFLRGMTAPSTSTV